MLILTVIKGPDKGKRFEVPDGEPQQIGRSSESLPLTDQTISRRHAELTPDGEQWLIRDLDSANGVYVNAARVNEAKLLFPGDQIRTGNTLFLVGRGTPSAVNRHGIKIAKAGELDVEIAAMVNGQDDSMIMAVPNPDQAAPSHLRMVYGVLELVGAVSDQKQLLERVMELVFQHFTPDRGFILLTDGSANARPEPAVVRYGPHHNPKKDKDEDRIIVSRTIVQHVMQNGVGMLSSNAMADQKFKASDSVMRAGMRSTLCVPIKFKGKLYGVIHLDSQIANFTFTDDQLRLLSAVGVATGLAIENQTLLSDQLRRERLAVIGTTVASLSHSIKNIIQGVRGGADVVELGLRKENLKVIHGGWDIVARNLDRISHLTLNMLAFSKQHQPDFEATDLNELLEECAELMMQQAERKEVALLSDLDPSVPLLPLDSNGIHQAVVNLLVNALDAVEQGEGVITLSTRYSAPAEAVDILVHDNGCGIEPSIRSRLFQPFQTTKGMRGTGLGLAVTKRLIEEHGGTIDVESRQGEGTTFRISLHTRTEHIPNRGDTQEPEAISDASADIHRSRLQQQREQRERDQQS